MTISGYSNAIVNTMLSWLKGFANWVLRLFNLAGSTSASPLLWLSHNWLKLLIFFMVLGVATDILVWLVRWRPHWVWFRKERVIVDDDRFFTRAEVKEDLDFDDENFLEKNWQERDYVVASTVVKRSEPGQRRESRGKRRGGRPSTVVKRRRGADDRIGTEGATGSFQRGERRQRPGTVVRTAEQERRLSEAEEKGMRIRAERESGLLGLDGGRGEDTDFYEDEVFNVSSLPSADEYRADGDAQ